ncbi:large subunit ribosomal protein L25 [Candidatus Kinetoplastibacterium desouzaii TCC079E]|uniref:Large ribosomal subunit protein bL25 n=1 Tax=Candidatus Kinetoplastidibacterium desouzai TCC079E TaxID=1208919 RepID=M1LLM9_9PROT|nr:50S ribosomal protein L25/general stress protein Ctc [Candidatus Kinetoplastibacterium desouzaii]AGF46657.1 large subunit ribosomal protein L25 [Candidatus Kinetoplastibacterium desouzaii TCC079E]
MKFNATLRSVHGTSASRRLRHNGCIPAVVYGGNIAPLNIELDHNEIYHALRKEEFHSSVLEMYMSGTNKTEQVILRSVQWHPYKQQVLHVDFQRVSANQNINTKIPLHFLNEDISPAVKLEGAIVSHIITELEISCLPSMLPQFIDIDLSKIELGKSIHLSDITLPQGVVYNGSDIDPLLASALANNDISDGENGSNVEEKAE